MAVVKTLDVFCDAPGCFAWTHGAVGRKAFVDQARERAALDGWWHGKIEGTSQDRCPAHRPEPGRRPSGDR